MYNKLLYSVFIFCLLFSTWTLSDSQVYAQQANQNNGSNFEATEQLTKETLDSLNPLRMTDPKTKAPLADQTVANQLTTPGSIVSRILDYAFPLSGMILMVMLVWGGFEILAGAANKKSMDSGRQRITAAIVGFLILFCAYWIMQIISYIFGIVIL